MTLNNQDLDPEGAKITAPDERDKHQHVVLPEKLDANGNGLTEFAAGSDSKPHRHKMKNGRPVPHENPDMNYVSRHPGPLRSVDMFQERTTIQTLIFDKKNFDLKAATKWARDNNFKVTKTDETGTSFRIRQKNPGEFKPKSFRTITLRAGIKAVIGRPKMQMNEVLPDIRFMEFMAAPFSVYGGKRNLAAKIAAMVPPHKTYVEPFAGAAAVLFARDPSEREILADVDPEKIAALRFLKSFSDGDARVLRRKNWTPSKNQFLALKDLKITDPVSRFHQWLYTRWNSFGNRGDSWAVSSAHNWEKFIDVKMPRYRERLKNVKIYQADWKHIVRQFDSPETFFYFDPPYIGTSNKKARFFKEPTADELRQFIANIRGKFLISNSDVPEIRQAFAKFRIQGVEVSTNVDQVHKTSQKVRKEVLISNYEVVAKHAEDLPEEKKGEAADSAREGKVIPGRFFSMPKPKVGAKPNQPFDIGNFLEHFDENDFPVFSSKKFSGIRGQIHRVNGKITIYTDDAQDITSRLPKIVAEALKLRGENFALDAEFELWIEGMKQSRDAMHEYLASQSPPDDKNVVANVFDLPSANDVIEKRFDELGKIGITQSTSAVPNTGTFNIVPHVVSKTHRELGSQTDMLRRLTGSEGNVAKKSGSQYSLSGVTGDEWIKFRNTGRARVVVTDKVDTEVRGAFSFEIGLPLVQGFKAAGESVRKMGEREVLIVGKASSPEGLHPNVGDTVEVEFSPLKHQLFSDGVERISFGVPRLLTISELPPQDVTEAIRAAKDGFTYEKQEVKNLEALHCE